MAALSSGIADANELAASKAKFVKFDHVFVIMMENQTNTDILGNPNAPFINGYANIANHATNYFAVGHPSAPNYLEIVGGSNFGLTNDFWPVWANGGCVDNAPGSTGCVNAFTPISAAGARQRGRPRRQTGRMQRSGHASPARRRRTTARSTPTRDHLYPEIDRRSARRRDQGWKTYQESLPAVPLTGAPPAAPPLGVNYSDGAVLQSQPGRGVRAGSDPKLYAVKHNPFAYFKNIQLGSTPGLSFEQIGFRRCKGLWADLASGRPPALDRC